jgi:hypothetical protein
MKRILLIASVLLSMVAQAQDTTKVSGYAAVSASLTNGDKISSASYFMVEGGICRKNISVGVGLGRSSFNFQTDGPTNYFIEPKLSVIMAEIGNVKGYGIAGVGTYFKSTHCFVEYGAGAIVSLKNLDLCFQISNWDNAAYVSTGISKTF